MYRSLEAHTQRCIQSLHSHRKVISAVLKLFLNVNKNILLMQVESFYIIWDFTVVSLFTFFITERLCEQYVLYAKTARIKNPTFHSYILLLTRSWQGRLSCVYCYVTLGANYSWRLPASSHHTGSHGDARPRLHPCLPGRVFRDLCLCSKMWLTEMLFLLQSLTITFRRKFSNIARKPL